MMMIDDAILSELALQHNYITYMFLLYVCYQSHCIILLYDCNGVLSFALIFSNVSPVLRFQLDLKPGGRLLIQVRRFLDSAPPTGESQRPSTHLTTLIRLYLLIPVSTDTSSY